MAMASLSEMLFLDVGFVVIVEDEEVRLFEAARTRVPIDRRHEFLRCH